MDLDGTSEDEVYAWYYHCFLSFACKVQLLYVQPVHFQMYLENSLFDQTKLVKYICVFLETC